MLKSALVVLFASFCLAFPHASFGSEKKPCPSRILQLAGSEESAHTKLAAITRQLLKITLSPDERANRHFMAAKIYWTLGPQAFGQSIRTHLDEALRVEPLHYEARMLSVNLSLFEDSLGLDPFAIEEALFHIEELMAFPKVLANAELFDLLVEQKLRFEKELRRSGSKLPNPELVDPLEELRATETLVWDIAARAETFSQGSDLQASLDSESLHEMVERFGQRVVALLLEERPIDAVMEYSRLLQILYYQTQRLPPDLRVSLLRLALNMAEEFSALGTPNHYGEVKGWCFQVWKQLRQSSQSLSAVSWIDLFIAGHLSAGDTRAAFWQGAYNHFGLDEAFGGAGEFFFLDRVILRHLKRLADET